MEMMLKTNELCKTFDVVRSFLLYRNYADFCKEIRIQNQKEDGSHEGGFSADWRQKFGF